MYPYPTEIVRPYVYILTHRTTGEFYIGYREKNKDPSHIDLPKYRTSSRKVFPMFDQFDWLIYAEFEFGDDAFDFEQHLISEFWGNPLLLNEQFRAPNKGKRFKAKRGRICSPETREKIRAARANQIITADIREKISETLKGRPSPNKGKFPSIETRKKLSNAGRKRKHSSQAKSKIGNANSKAVSVNGITYQSMTIAAISLGLNYTTLVARIRSKSFPEYTRVAT